MNIFIDDGGSGGVINDGYTTSGLVLMVDASRTTSYPGTGETWANVVASPADSSLQTDYDFCLGQSTGNTTDNPAFVSAGTASYFATGSGAYHNFIKSAANVSTFLKNLHKSGSKFTVEIWMRWSGTEAPGIGPFFDSGTSDQGGSDVSRGVVYVDLGNSHATRGHAIRVKRDSSGASALAVKADAAITGSAVTMLACSIDGTGVASSFLYKNGAYDPVSASNTFNGTFATPGTTDIANAPKIGARGDSISTLPALTRVYLLRVYNTNLSKAELDTNWNNDRARFGL